MVPCTTSASGAASTVLLPSTMRPLQLPNSSTNSCTTSACDEAPSNKKDHQSGKSRRRLSNTRTSSSSSRSSSSGGSSDSTDRANNTQSNHDSISVDSSSSSSRGPIIVVLEEVLRDLSQQISELGPNHLSVAETWNTLGLIRLHMQRDVRAALQCHQRALQIYQYHTNNKNNNNNKNSSSSSSSASSSSSSSFSIDSGATPLQWAVTLNDLGKCLERNDQREEALEKYLEAQRFMRQANRSHKDIVATSIDRAIARLQRC